MSVIKNNLAWLACILLLIVLYSCKGQEKIVGDPVVKTLNERQMGEYNYALTEATKQKLFGNFPQAAALYKKCIEVNPASDAAHFQLSGLMMMNRDINGAIGMNEKAVQLNPDNFWYRLQLGQLYMFDEKTDDAIRTYSGIIQKWPDKLDVKYELARMHSESGTTEEALKILNEIEREHGLAEPVSLLKEQIYMREEKPDLAEEEMMKLLALSPEDIRYLGILAELYTSTGETQKALETYRKIFDIEPQNGIAQLSIAEFYRINDDPVKYFINLEKAINNPSLSIDRKMLVIIDLMTNEELFSSHKDEILLLIGSLEKQYPDDFRVQTAKADYLAKVENYDEALELYNQVLKEQTGNYYIWEQTVFIENMLDRPQAVFDRCNEALKHFEDRPLLYLFKGNAASQLNMSQEALKSLERGLEYAANNIPLKVQFYSILAEAWRNEGSHIKSDNYFDLAIDIEPENMMILNNYSYYLSLRGERLKEAEKMSRKTIESNPKNPTYLDTYGWILFKSGKFGKALDYLDGAFASGGSNDPDILEHYGDVLEAMGKNQEAKKYWQKALDNGGSSKELKNKLNQ